MKRIQGFRCLFKLLLCLPIYLLPIYSHAQPLEITGVAISLGSGKPQNLRGGRISVLKHWAHPLTHQPDLNLLGYWDFSVAKWQTDRNHPGQNTRLWALAAAPVLRLQYQRGLPWLGQPFAELSVGGVWLSDDKIANRDLGSHVHFQDTMGLGTQFGPQRQFEISYRFLHYSNLDFALPNQGVDIVHFLTFAYRWTPHAHA